MSWLRKGEAAVHLSRFVIKRLPGITRKFTISAQPGLNLLIGPNGSGKSSTARALAYLLWPAKYPGSAQIEAQAYFQINSHEELVATTTTTAVIWTQNGATVPAPELPSAHLAACYHLDVLDIIKPTMASDDARLARDLAKELSGGIDKSLLQERLFSLGRLSASRKNSTLQTAQRQVIQVQQQQKALAAQQATLTGLEEKVKRANQAGLRAEILAAIISRRSQQAQLNHRETELLEIPPGAQLIRQEDPGRLRNLKHTLAEKTKLLVEAKLKQEKYQQQLAVISPPPALGALAALSQGEGLVAALATTETQHQEIERSLAQHLETQRRLAGQTWSESQGSRPLEQATINNIMAAWNTYQGHELRSQVLRKILSSATQTRQNPARYGWPGAAAGLLGGAVFSFTQHTEVMVYAGLGILGLLALGYALYRLRRPSPPLTSQLQPELQDEQKKAQQAKATLDQLLQDAGLDLDMVEPSSLLLLQRMRAQWEQQEETARLQDNVVIAQKSRAEALANVNTLLNSWGSSATIMDLHSARAALVSLKETWQQRQNLLEKIEISTLEISNLGREISQHEEEIKQILQTFQLDPSRDPVRSLEQLLELQPRYQELTAQVLSLRQNIASLNTTVEGQGNLFPDEDPQQLSATEIQIRIAREKELFNESHQVSQKIGALRQQIETASAGHDLETACAQRDEAHNQLQAAYERELEVELGKMMLEQVMGEYQITARPAALAEANRIFGTIARGQSYHLNCLIGDDGEPAVIVHDVDQGQDLLPSQLSTGTRTQLFLALRLGFLATQTKTLQPPVVLDDVLTTSDPARFEAAVTSLGRLAREHEFQIFYLCSRPDEVAAWQHTLSREHLPTAHVIDLAALRKQESIATSDILSLWDSGSATALPPVPSATMTPAEYALELQVPQPRTWDTPGSLHLFFLLADNLMLLHQFLMAGVEKVGHWQSHGTELTKSGAIPSDQAHYLGSMIKIWERFLTLWRIGRPPLVTAQFLADCPAVSPSFLPTVQKYLQTINGVGSDLIEGLRQGKVAKFRAAKTEQLANELQAAGLLDQELPLPQTEIVREIFADSTLDLQTAPVKKEAILLLVDRLGKALASEFNNQS